MYTRFTKGIVAILIAVFLFPACTKYPYPVDYETIRGAVIGKENCKGSTIDDYWLIDLSVYSNNDSQYGDTVTFNGTFYAKAIKLKGLDKSLQAAGTRLAIDFKVISADKVITTGCMVSNPTTYPLREITIISQGLASF